MSVHFSMLGPSPSLINCILLPDNLENFQVVAVFLYNLFRPGAQSVPNWYLELYNIIIWLFYTGDTCTLEIHAICILSLIGTSIIWCKITPSPKLNMVEVTNSHDLSSLLNSSFITCNYISMLCFSLDEYHTVYSSLYPCSIYCGPLYE